MVKVTIALIVLACSAMMGQTHGSPMDEQEAEFMRKYDGLSVYDRNLATWKTEYAAKIAAYKDKLYKSGTTEVDEAQMCDNTQELRDDIAEVETAIINKESGVKAKQDQLKQLQDILDHPDFDGITGLKDVLQGYIDTHKVENDADLVTLATEKTDVQTYKNQIDSYSCPCVWNEWGEWASAAPIDVCSVDCGGGIEYRRRTVRRQPTNGGTSCEDLKEGSEVPTVLGGSLTDLDTQDCNTHPCPVNCVWNSWAEWDMSADGCSKECGPGERRRIRSCTTASNNCYGLHGGDDCVGFNYETKFCNVLDETQALVSQQETLIALIQECASDCDYDSQLCGSEDVLPNKCG